MPSESDRTKGQAEDKKRIKKSGEDWRLVVVVIRVDKLICFCFFLEGFLLCNEVEAPIFIVLRRTLKANLRSISGVVTYEGKKVNRKMFKMFL